MRARRRRVALSLLAALAASAGAGCATGPGEPSSGPYCDTLPGSGLATFADPELEAAVREALGALPGDRLTCALVSQLTSLNAGERGVRTMEGIQSLVGLTTLWIRGNEITDASPVAALRGLTSLNLAANRLADVEALRGLTSLTFLAINDNGAITDLGPLRELTSLSGTLWIGGNRIRDLGPLSGLTSVEALNAWDNDVRDVDALAGMRSLRELRLQVNALDDVSGLRDLPSLSIVWLHTNPELADVGALLESRAIGVGTSVNLRGTAVPCPDVDALTARGASVLSDCP